MTWPRLLVSNGSAACAVKKPAFRTTARCRSQMIVVGLLDRLLDVDGGVVDEKIERAAGRCKLDSLRSRRPRSERSAGAAISRSPPPAVAIAASTASRVRSLTATVAPAS